MQQHPPACLIIVKVLCFRSKKEGTKPECLDFQGLSDLVLLSHNNHLSKQAEKLGLPVPGALYVGGSADSAWTAMVGAPTLCGMGPQAVGAHSNNEYLFVPSMTERAQLLAMCIMHLDEMQ